MKSWDLSIAHNAFRTREDVQRGLGQILEPLASRLVRGGSGLHVGNTSAHYADSVALLEGYSRLLWGLAPLLAGGGSSALIEPMVMGLKQGSDPSSPYFWGIGGDRDQRYVEMAAFAYALTLAPRVFWDPLSEDEKARLCQWLGGINSVELPPNNWEFFRVLVNSTLKKLDRPFDSGRLAIGFELIDRLYRGDGWYIDETNYDFYNPFAFHYYGLFFAKTMFDVDPVRARSYRERARLFAAQYLPWFASDGSMVPYGRSLTYRFAAASFFSALAFSGEDVLPLSAVKGLILRHARYWFSKPIFDHEGLLSIGYGYPNLLMAEQYNAPGSPYWSLKFFLPLAIPAGDPFWISEEADMPQVPNLSRNAASNSLICRSGRKSAEQVYLLTAGQYPCWESVHAAAKYAKFAYSNRFAFCVSHGSYDLSKTGCDSMLLFSEGDGYWRERRQTRDRTSNEDYVASTWNPWPDVEVRTYLIPCGAWHLRIHVIQSQRQLETVEGGFSLPAETESAEAQVPEVSMPADSSIKAVLSWAWGGIVDLGLGDRPRMAELHKPEPNLNLLYPRVYIPILRGSIAKGRSVLATAVAAGTDGADQVWGDCPAVSFDEGKKTVKIRSALKELEIILDGAKSPRPRHKE